MTLMFWKRDLARHRNREGRLSHPFGHKGASAGQSFDDREDLRREGLHYQKRAGIAGRAKDGAESIVMSGGYAHDVDLGDEIIYTGQGGQCRDSRQRTSTSP
jgi:putative restriction endonuclease